MCRSGGVDRCGGEDHGVDEERGRVQGEWAGGRSSGGADRKGGSDEHCATGMTGEVWLWQGSCWSHQYTMYEGFRIVSVLNRMAHLTVYEFTVER
jgi:hypothetical protein